MTDNTTSTTPPLTEGQRQLDVIMAALKSEEYPCPCWDEDTDKYCTNTVTLTWHGYYEEYHPMYEPRYEPEVEGCPKHIDRLNDDSHEAELLFARYYERRALLKLLEAPITPAGRSALGVSKNTEEEL